MSLPTSEPLPPENFKSLPAARRRRKSRVLLPKEKTERAAFLDELARRITPSFDFFLFSLLSGIVIGAALLLDSPALFVLGALLAPFMAPALGLSLASIVGSFNFFLMNLGSMATGSLLVFICGALAGWATRLWPTLVFHQAVFHTRFTWPDFIVLTLGAVLTIFLLVRSPQSKPLVASVALAYELYLPIGAAGFGLTSAVAGLWPDGLIVFIVSLAWAALAGTLVLAILGLRPVTFFGYTLGSSLVLISLAAVIAISGIGTALFARVAMPPPPPTKTATITPTRTPTLTPVPPTSTLTPTLTLVPSATQTASITPQPTPIWARISAGQFSGALVRADPNVNGKVIKSLLNGMLVQVLPEAAQNGGITWVHIRTSDGTVGWIVRSLLETATPSPGW
ncbi:MAG TPA: SH3 domain-containing protein [Anaerolineaceae bacterium]|nr:SH3 domain-containing protein [Anaerolineaceae bacterium]